MAAAKVLCPMEAWEPWAVEAASPALVRGERVLATQHGVGLYAVAYTPLTLPTK